jgi:hypothetical protein
VSVVPGAPGIGYPWSIDVRRASIERLDVASGGNRWRFARLAFRYAGGDKHHALDELAFHSDWGDLSGNIAIDAAPPFVTTGSINFLASDALKRAKAALAIAGDLTTLVFSGDVSAVGARAGGTARISPFDERWLQGFELAASDVDLALFDARVPKTSLSLTAEGASSERGQVRGKFAARNAEAGTIDSNRLPILALSSSFEFAAGTVTLTRSRLRSRQRSRRRKPPRGRRRSALEPERSRARSQEHRFESQRNATRRRPQGAAPPRHRITRGRGRG